METNTFNTGDKCVENAGLLYLASDWYYTKKYVRDGAGLKQLPVHKL